MTRTKTIAAFTAAVALLLPSSAGAISIVPSCALGSDVPDLNCVLLTLGNIAQLILAVAGGLSLLMFVYGGFMMLSSGGAQGKVTQGKDAIKAALIGLAIILLAGYLINFGLDRLKVGSEFREEPKATEEDSGDASAEEEVIQLEPIDIVGDPGT